MLNMDCEEIKSVFDSRKLNHDIHFELKLEQISAARSVLHGRNCVCFLPTGYGKTLCFIINTVVMDKPSITLTISPLLSLVDNQIGIFTKWRFTCARIGTGTSFEEAERIAHGDYSFVFASPEYVLKPKWHKIFMTDVLQEQVTCIVFDEAHCISEWGEDFRPDYKDVAQIRSLFKVPVMVLTATSTVETKADIMSVLHLTETDTDFITRSADRPNIFIECQKRKISDYDDELKWLIDYLKTHGNTSKKIVIYCRSIDTVSETFITMKESLGKCAYIDQVEKSSHLIVEMYHKCTHESSKSRILNEFSKSTSSIRCLLATVALGMGIDIKDIDLIIHIGCPKYVISYWQEAGRCARDGRKGMSLILYDNFTAALKSTNKAMSAIVKNVENKCLRQMIIDHFTVSSRQEFSHTICLGCESLPCYCDNCTCCSVCSRKCPCTEKDQTYAMAFLSKQHNE